MLRSRRWRPPWLLHRRQTTADHCSVTANPRTENLDFRVFDSSMFLILRGGIPRSKGVSHTILTQRFSVCGFSVCELTVATAFFQGAVDVCVRTHGGAHVAIHQLLSASKSGVWLYAFVEQNWLPHVRLYVCTSAAALSLLFLFRWGPTSF